VVLPPLAGFAIAVTADRRADEQAELLRRRGAEVLHGPVIRTAPLAEGPELDAATEALIARPPDTLVALTGLGVRSWFEAADGRGRGDALRDALAETCVLARGPKAAGALATVGLEAAWRAPGESSAEVAEHLGAALAGRRIAVQRDGAAEPFLADLLATRGADVVDVPVYRWELPLDLGPACSLLQAVLGEQVDAVTFTSAAAISNLFAIARLEGGDAAGDAVAEALRGPVLPICVGPVSAARLAVHGVPDGAHPERWRLGPMVRCLVDSLASRRRTVTLGGAAADIQGTAVRSRDIEVSLSRREAQLLSALVDAGGAVVAKDVLARTVWEPSAAPHLVEVTVARLRQRLGPIGSALETVPRRGYRIAPEAARAAGS
jgi:uroporphyrinogen-III synthase